MLESLSLYEISENERDDIEQLSPRIESLDTLKLEACSFKDCFLLEHCDHLQQLFLTGIQRSSYFKDFFSALLHIVAFSGILQIMVESFISLL